MNSIRSYLIIMVFVHVHWDSHVDKGSAAQLSIARPDKHSAISQAMDDNITVSGPGVLREPLGELQLYCDE